MKNTEKNNFEMYFEWWLDDLIKEGDVISYEREPKTFVLCDEIKPSFIKATQLKTKVKQEKKKFTLFNEVSYTPDYVVVFTQKGAEKWLNRIFSDGSLEKSFDDKKPFIFCGWDKTEIEVYFDVKPPSKAIRFSSSLGSSREFPIKQRLMFERYGIYVNKVVPIGSKNALFNKTFIPERYKLTDKGTRLRKLW